MASRTLRWVYVWEFPVRLFHWINVACLCVLATTGLLIGAPLALVSGAEAWAGYWFGWVRLLHFTAAYLLVANLAFRIYWAFAGNRFANWKAFVPVRAAQWREVLRFLRVYFWVEPWPGNPQAGHNALQALAYLGVVVLMLFQVFTGFALYRSMSGGWLPWLFGWVVPLLGGDMIVRQWHHLALWAFVIFLILHVYLVFINDRQDRQGLFSSIVTGWKVVSKE